MSTTTTVTQLDGYFKRVYGNLTDAVPSALYIQRNVRLTEAQKIGNSFEFPVKLRGQNGLTIAGANAGAFTLRDPDSVVTQNAVVNGSQVVNRGIMDYETAAKATAGGLKAFGNSTRFLIDSTYTQTQNALEVMDLYGQSGIGVVNAQVLSPTASTTSVTLQVTRASWAGGIWAAFEGAAINFYDGASLVSSGDDAVFKIAGSDAQNRYVTVTGTATGISALLTALSNPLDVFFAGGKDSEYAGIDRIITNTGSLFSIDASVYNLWRGNVAPSVALTSLTIESLGDAVAIPAQRGLDEDVVALVNPTIWSSLLNDQAALRRYDGTGTVREMSNGARAISFHTQTGTIDIVAHKFVKEGDIFILPMTKLKRIGATDVTFRGIGSNDQIFRHLDSQAGFEYRCYGNQALIHEAPAMTVKLPVTF